jgi:Domain of unknown function (DUF3291)
MPFVSVTRLRVRSWRYLPVFLIGSLRSAQQAKSAEGNLAVSLLRQPQNTYWTRTVWTSETAMKAFMLAGAHRGVMRKLLNWCDEAALVHWTQDSAVPPEWPEARAKMQAIGRTSKVNYPSEDHRAFRIPELKEPIKGETRLK